MSADDLPRKKRIRGGHRATAKRLIDKVSEELNSFLNHDSTENSLNALKARFEQLKSSLTEKLSVLKALDDAILELVAEDEIELEITTSDEYREQMSLTLARIDNEFYVSNITRCVSDMNVSNVNVAKSPNPFNEIVDAEEISAREEAEHLSDIAESRELTMTASSSNAVTETFVPNHCDIPSNATVPNHCNIPSNATVPNHLYVPSNENLYMSSKVKLPKLELKKFDGDSSKWTAFWDSFESSIHLNSGLNPIDKFNYLMSLIEGAAEDAISGLSLNARNYEEAIEILKRRFGNKQQIINRHMNILLNLDAVNSNQNLKALRVLHDTIEAHVRSLKSLGVPSESYGSLLSSILMNKLPNDIKLTITREVREDEWKLDKLVEILRREIEARERANGNTSSTAKKNVYTAAALVNNSTQKCTFCKSSHKTYECTEMTDVQSRKNILKKEGRCFLCLRKGHLLKECKSKYRCNHCDERHSACICTTRLSAQTPSTKNKANVTPAQTQQVTDTSVNLSDSSTKILLQTAKGVIYNPKNPNITMKARLILDSGSQRTYISTKLRNILNLESEGKCSMAIKTFGSNEDTIQTIDQVQFGVKVQGEPNLQLSALVVPLICQPLQGQTVSTTAKMYKHLQHLKLADFTSGENDSEVDILIGSDEYWKIVTGKIRQGDGGPTAVHTKLGWVLSGPTKGQTNMTGHNNLVATHVLKCTSHPNYEDPLCGELRKFWDLESIGIKNQSVHEEFLENISYENNHYTVNLPWKSTHPNLPDNFDLSEKRLNNLLKRLKTEPDVLKEYNQVIQDQLEKGIVEVVDDKLTDKGNKVHYIPHHAVIRRDKTTTKLRVVYDASAKSNKGGSLNECLHAGPVLTQNIMDIMLRFRNHKIALTGDIEKAFLMVHINETDRDALRFLWIDDLENPSQEPVILRFTRVVFGVSSSPFLLNATLKHHIEKYKEEDPEFVCKFLNAIYVDDLSSGGEGDAETYELYLKCKMRLAEAGFNMRKFATNSPKLRRQIENNEACINAEDTKSAAVKVKDTETRDDKNCEEEDATYSDSTLGDQTVLHDDQQKILGSVWNFDKDILVFDLKNIVSLASEIEPTKRSVISISSRFYDPLGIISPIVIKFKLMFQDLCGNGGDWDKKLEGEMKKRWDSLIKDLQDLKPITIPRCYFSEVKEKMMSCELHGFCDASTRAYGAVIYLRMITTTEAVYTTMVASKARVAPLNKQTIPRLELLSALILARLITNVKQALESEMKIDKIAGWTDAKVSLYWIVQEEKEWKQYVQNRVDEIRRLLPARFWNHCPGVENPADILSRGIKPAELANQKLWWHGPDWLCDIDKANNLNSHDEPEVPEECITEMKIKSRNSMTTSCTLISDTRVTNTCLSNVIDYRSFSSFDRLVRVTALVRKFIKLLKDPKETREVTSEDIKESEMSWIKEVQAEMRCQERFEKWNQEFQLWCDEEGILRCKGRFGNTNLPYSSKHPILLNNTHHVSALLVWRSHKRVMHGGVKETLTELRAQFWIIHGRNFIRRLLWKCVTCKKADGRPYKAHPPPDLPKFRVTEAIPFAYTGLDYIGPLFVRAVDTSNEAKVWICLLTCCVTRAVHLELVPNQTPEAFIRCFRRFTARRSTPEIIVSDNSKTFKSAAKHLNTILKDPQVKKYLSQNKMKWTFTLEKAPWWGGMYERLVKMVKRCLKKTLGQAKLSYDELSTAVTEVEGILNSRPLSYVSTEDIDEPLTPSHLLHGHRILSMPDKEHQSYDPEFEITTDDLTNRMKHLSMVIDHFWKRWKNEYLLELRNTHKYKPCKGSTYASIGDIVLVHDEKLPRSRWRIGVIRELIHGADNIARGAVVAVSTKGGRRNLIRRPVQLLYPLEIKCTDVITESEPAEIQSPERSKRPRRKAAVMGEQLRRQWIAELQNNVTLFVTRKQETIEHYEGYVAQINWTTGGV